MLETNDSWQGAREALILQYQLIDASKRARTHTNQSEAFLRIQSLVA